MEAALRKSPTFGTASVVFTVLTIAAPFLAFAFFSTKIDTQEKTGWEWLGLVLVTLIIGAIGAGIAAVGGVISGVIGLVRGERSRWLSVVGLVFSGSVLLTLLYTFIVTRTPGPGS